MKVARRKTMAALGVVCLISLLIGTLTARILQEEISVNYDPEQRLALPPLQLQTLAEDQDGMRLDQLLPNGGLVHFWASWCRPCAVEHPRLMALAARGVPIVGIAYADNPQTAQAFLAERGNPFSHSLQDQVGHSDFSFGLEGIPSTFFVDGEGMISGSVFGLLEEERLPEDLGALLESFSSEH